MNKRKISKFILVFVLILSVVLSTCLTGCGNSDILMKYDNQIHSDKSYDANLFYRNDLEVNVADPFVMRITDEESTEYGYYYLYGTNASNGFIAYRSKNLDKWEDMFTQKGFMAMEVSTTGTDFQSSYFWAPEVVYDQETDKYYMYYSAKTLYYPEKVGAVYLFCAVADEPYGPFEPLIDDTHTSIKSPFFDVEKGAAAMTNAVNGIEFTYPTAIDPHPFVDPATGKKYLYFTNERNENAAGTYQWGCELKSWTEPDYSTFVRLTEPGYKTVGDLSKENLNDAESLASGGTNEGGAVIARKQADGSYRYYLTTSINSWRDKSYSVIQAIGDSPLGPFEKVSLEDGGVILGTDFSLFDHVSGTGHHSFVTTANGEIYIAYHEHYDRTFGNSARHLAFDKVEFVKNSKGEEVLYVNGPTWSLQPKVEANAKYVNIADDAKVKVSSGKNVSALTDGLLTMYSYVDYVKDFRSTKSTTITLTFDDYREVSALMVYNGLNYEETFVKVNRIEFDFKDEAKNFTGTAVINNLEFDWEFYKQSVLDYMRPGGSAVAVFNPIMVKEIRIKINVPKKRPEGIELIDEFGYVKKQKAISVSEIKVLGR